MDIGSKLKQARQRAGLTQEQAAGQIGVSRQTMSSWENNKSYPDVVSVIRLSDLYAVTLDELLKGDPGMIEHLNASTSEVKARQKFSRQLQVMVYLMVWALSVLSFWLGGRTDAMAYSIIVLWLVLPVTTLVVAVFIGKDESRNGTKWLMLLFFGVMHSLAGYATFDLANAIAFQTVRLPDLETMYLGILCAAAGMGLGTAMQAIQKRRAARSAQP